jgi:VWFA-related protein
VVDRTGELAAAVDPSARQTVAANTKERERVVLKSSADLSANGLTHMPVKADAAASEPAATPANLEPKDPNAIRIETRLVNLNVRALTKAGLPLVDLQPADFEIFEDEVRQEVAHFRPVNTPVNLLVLLDMSGSTQKKHKTMIESVRKFIDLLPANDKMSIVAFTRKYHRLTPFTSDKRLLKAAVERIKDIRGGTAYYDAMVEAMTDLNKLGDVRKAIVVLTDGEDESMFGQEPTGFSFEQMLERAAESDVTIYPIYFANTDQYQKLGFVFGGNPHWNRQSDRRTVARKQLQAVADQTGGEVVNAQTEGDLAGAYARVANELHTLYSLAYSPDKLKHDGLFRKISVKVTRDGALAKTRKGYYDK